MDIRHMLFLSLPATTSGWISCPNPLTLDDFLKVVALATLSWILLLAKPLSMPFLSCPVDYLDTSSSLLLDIHRLPLVDKD